VTASTTGKNTPPALYLPLDVYIVVSVANLLLFRICNFLGIKIATGDYLAGGQNQQENE